MPAIYSPEMAMAGFGDISGGSPPQVNYVARLDGATQYWQLSSPITVQPNYTVVFEFANFVENSSGYLICNETSTSFSVFNGYEGNVARGSSTEMIIDVDGLGPDVITHDGNNHIVTLSILEAGSFSKLATRFNITRLLDGYIKHLYVYDENEVLVNEILLTNKNQGANQIATAGSVNAFMPNYTGTVWVKESEL